MTAHRARPWVLAASVLGLAHAAVSLTWVFGSTWLLGTVGGSIEDWGRDGDTGVRLALLVVVLAKVAAVAVLWLAVVRGTRVDRALAWVTGTVLAVYGAVLTVAGVVIANSGAIDDATDPYALRWHAYFWDPWFLVWGVCTLAAVVVSRRQRPGTSQSP